MSLPQRIYELGRDVANSALVKTHVVNTENVAEFTALLNQAWPVDEVEMNQRNLVRAMYYSNPAGFLQYISSPKNRVRSLILWTESKQIVKFYRLQGVVHVSWNEDTKDYLVTQYLSRAERGLEPFAQDAADVDTTDDQDAQPPNTPNTPRQSSRRVAQHVSQRRVRNVQKKQRVRPAPTAVNGNVTGGPLSVSIDTLDDSDALDYVNE
jgi:hypothetical protein